MKIEHIGIWCKDIEITKAFYLKYFNVSVNARYNNAKGFSSYFLTFDSGCRLEIMQNPQSIKSKQNKVDPIAPHFAISLGSKLAVDAMTQKMKEDGLTILSLPRTTGDLYYESLVLSPDGHHIELTV